VDLSADIVDTRRAADRYVQPSVHLSQQLASPRSRRTLPVLSAAREWLTYEDRYAELPAAPRSRRLRYRSND
jgi:hypothetical protein